ncbi:ATP-binding protein [Actinoplanes sp. CA-030573]|uniref:ATP-binding protein n=1 Tax=Actinoplanes sp. CA-030573 TaxID=3239898 RepID=UPI003D8F7007
MPKVADLLEQARARSFVGRDAELAAFDRVLARGGVLFLHGPGGIGKSSTLQQFGRRARAAGRTVAVVDGREADAAPDTFRGLDAGVLLVDGYERLAALDGWLRREFLPARAGTDVVVLAGREPPGPAWRTDPGWRSIATFRRLDPLGSAESMALLARAGVPPEARDGLAALGRGHPLALALLADATVTGVVPRALADVPDLITALLECLVREPPTDAHATGLATCAKAWLTTEDLLRATVGADAGAVWEWLCRRPFITWGPRGLRPHELARDVLDAEFERRSPDRYRALHRIVHDHTVAGVRAAAGADRQLNAQHLLYLHRSSPLSAVFQTLRDRGPVALVPGAGSDHDQVVDSVRQFQGPESAALAREWLARQPEGLSVVRGECGLLAYVLSVVLPVDGDLESRDPVARAALASADLRPGEQAGLARFLAGAENNQRDLYAVLAGAVSSILEWIGRPTACSFVAIADPGFWGPMFDYLAFTPAFEAEVGGQRHVVYGMDWRRLPVDTWLDLMNEREQAGGTGPPPPGLLRPPPPSREAFAAAVRQALRDPTGAAGSRAGLADAAGSRAGLAGAPGSRAGLADAAGFRAAHAAPDGAVVSRAALEKAVAVLAAEPKGAPLAAVLQRTYLRPAPSQEAAAEVLGLPFSTYRRHLAKAVDRLTEILWRAETGQEVSTERSGE